VHGGGAARLGAGVRYVVTNLIGSTLFLIGLGVVYATTGTLNMADLAVKVASLPPGEFAMIRVAAVMLLMVFAVKAALVPLQVWLPGTYAAAPATVAALFAVMTKVGAYAALRFGTLVFPASAPAVGTLYGDVLLPAGLATLVVGTIGMLGAVGVSTRINRVAAFAVMSSSGILFVALSAFTPEAIAAGLYYLLQSTLAVAALFLLADVVGRQGGRSGAVAALFFVVAIAVAGMPPFAGFFGKLLILQARHDQAMLVWPVVLVTSLFALLALARLGSDVFWTPAEDPEPVGPPLPPAMLMAPALLMVAVIGLTVFAGPVTGILGAVAAALHEPAAYLAAVEALR
jgi:multicomponent K+:H+ antiporter subunit D